jgi:hypothetical protein
MAEIHQLALKNIQIIEKQRNSAALFRWNYRQCRLTTISGKSHSVNTMMMK